MTNVCKYDDAILALLTKLAEGGVPCPSTRELAKEIGGKCDNRTVSRAIDRLAKQRLIVCERLRTTDRDDSSPNRVRMVVTIRASGHKTARFSSWLKNEGDRAWPPRSVEHYWRVRRKYPSDAAYARFVGVTANAICTWRFANVSHAAEIYHAGRLMTEDEIAPLYRGRRYEDEPRAVFDRTASAA